MPFSNRIAAGRFIAGDGQVTLSANFIHSGRAQSIHGFGWQAVAEGLGRALLRQDYPGGEWPWPYRAEQAFALDCDSLVQTLSLTNHGDTPMPAGIGIHPYFPRAGAQLELDVDGRWDVDADCLPTEWKPLSTPPDWLCGDAIDHGFTGRRNPIRIDWPTHSLTITPDSALAHTIVYIPPGEDYFCVEPVSHMANAVNRAEGTDTTGLKWLEPEECWKCRVGFAAAAG